jgi:uncharacterized membrane protein
MKRRYVCVLLFAAPAFLASIIASFLLFGAAAGVLWLFVFGDNPWPSFANQILVAMLALTFMTSWVTFISVAYLAGKKQEARASLNAKHVAASAGATALLVVLALMYQWSVENIGTKADSLLCSEYCGDKGFAGSGMPPRDTGAATCSCFDAEGRETVTVPMRDLIAGGRR